MSEPQKKAGVAFWITVALLAVLVGYPLSIGPYVWLYQHDAVPDWAETPLDLYCWPSNWFLKVAPYPIAAPFRWYLIQWGWPWVR